MKISFEGWRQWRQLSWAQCVLAGIGLLTSLAAMADDNAPSHEGLVLVHRTVNAKYMDSFKAFSGLLKSTLTKPYVVKNDDSLEKLVSEQFGVGPTAAHDVYEQLADRIQTLNKLPSRGAIKAGATLALPDIPPMQWKEKMAGNPNYGMPRVQGGPDYHVVLSGKSMTADVADWRRILDKGRKAEPLVSQWRWVTVAQAKEEAKAEEEARAQAKAQGVDVAEIPTNAYWSQPLTLKFAADSVGAGQASSVQADLQLLAALIKRRPPQQEVVVYVLDDSWPTAEAFEASRQFFLKALNDIRTANFIPGAPPAFLAKDSVVTDFPAYTPPKPLHASKIATALADFTKLTPKVKVVYLPLFTQQKWAKEFWEELTYIALVTTGVHSKLGEIQPTDGIMNKARSDATQLVAQIPAKVVDSLGPAQQTPITVLQKVAQLYAMKTGTPFFISMSWTVETHEIDFGPDADALGVSLAATGNDGKEVIGDAIYLAYRGKAAPGDVLAVMNTDSTGKDLCGSGRLPLSGPNPFYGLAYDGTYSNGAECGSSFSTPRVAWLLGLRQAYNAPVSKAALPDWYASFRTQMISLQGATQTTSRRYWLPVAKLFDGL
ncbi:hypothetical protein [Roseateles asaccharophilus]|uniref:Uncharacterized protein n=1 Tax=Roseateles asaccharophilus TaxID=582607 RepID=A0ABU2AE83_9BURK|nr:hypothetical protein [Roseateles asaccharophilus]MDR7334308.1 hypothetical protein [Roseateles asaccharophilus]